MGSNEPLGEPSDVVESDPIATPISQLANEGLGFDEVLGENAAARGTDTNGPPPTWTPPNEDGSGGAAQDKGKDSCSGSGSKRKRGLISDEEVVVFNGMIAAVKDLGAAIRESAHAEAHPGVYNAVMTLSGFTPDALLSALGWLYEHKAQSIGFVQMSDEHRRMWMNHWIEKHYFNE